MKNFLLSCIVGAAALLFVTATPADLSAQGPIELADTPTELPNARGPWQFFSVTRDARRCPLPTCGGWWVQAVNEALTRCADGSWAQACYVATLDTSRVSGDLTKFDNSHNNLAFGRVKRQNYPYFGNLGKLVVTDAWYGTDRYGVDPRAFSTGFGPEWSAVWDNGIRCTTFPATAPTRSS